MPFDPQRAYHHTQQLAFPRRTGSSGEGQAQAYLATQLRATGLEVSVEPFTFSLFPTAIGLRLTLILLAAMILAAGQLAAPAPLPAALLLALTLMLACAGTRWSRWLERLHHVRPKRTARNLVARHLRPGADRELVFVAHYDSKSETLPLPLRFALYTLGLLGLLALAVLAMGSALARPIVSASFLKWSTIGVTLLLVPLLLNFPRNLSPGALDNASGLGVVLELARCLKELPLERTNLTFVFSGAEEEGLAGAMQYMAAHARDFPRSRTFFVNYDGPGAPGKLYITSRYGLPPRRTSRTLAPLALSIAAEQGIPAAGSYLLAGAGVDSIPISWHGFETITLHSAHLGRGWLCVHSRCDTLAHVSPAALGAAGALSVELARRIEQ
ncbi:MAG: M28 family peptidase [Deinococcus sp.]|nr:M28 family peptidase [Deinococcus sp.]